MAKIDLDKFIKDFILYNERCDNPQNNALAKIVRQVLNAQDLEVKDNDLIDIQKESELTEFEKAYSLFRYGSEATARFKDEQIKQVKEEAATILDIARKEILKDMPKWKVAEEDIIDRCYCLG